MLISDYKPLFFDVETIPRDWKGCLAEAEKLLSIEYSKIANATEPKKENKDGSTSKIWEKWKVKREEQIDNWAQNKDLIYQDILNGISKEHSTHPAKCQVISIAYCDEKGEGRVITLHDSDTEQKILESFAQDLASMREYQLVGFNNDSFDDVVLRLLYPANQIHTPAQLYSTIDMRKALFGYSKFAKGKLDDAMELFHCAPDPDDREDGSAIFPHFLKGEWNDIKRKNFQDVLGLKNIYNEFVKYGGRF